MASKRTTALALRWGHPTPFRKTVAIGEGESVQLVFEPGVKYRVTAKEVAALKRFIDSGLLVDPGADIKGRYQDCREVASTLEPEPETLAAAE